MYSEAEACLIEKLKKIETLFARTNVSGERQAAESALARIKERLQQIESTEPAVEYRFSMPDTWSRSLFIALLHRYGLQPYRYRRQRYTTVMVRVTATFVDEVLWPHYIELNTTLIEHLEEVTQGLIKQSIYEEDVEVEERDELRSIRVDI